MARIRKDGTILLNDVQMATYEELLTKRNKSGIVNASIVAGYKQNVIKSIVKHGAMRWTGKNGDQLKAVAKAVVIPQPTPIPRTSDEMDMSMVSAPAEGQRIAA